jgi:hypothetical protein
MFKETPFLDIVKFIILKTKLLNKSFGNIYPNTKYNLDDILKNGDCMEG